MLKASLCVGTAVSVILLSSQQVSAQAEIVPSHATSSALGASDGSSFVAPPDAVAAPFASYPAASTDQQPSAVGQDIIVTAQRWAENVKSVPISITALNGTMLKNSDIATLYDLPRVAPSLKVDVGFTATRAPIRSSDGEPSGPALL